MSQQLEERLNELRELAGQYAKAEAERTYLTHFRQVKLAVLMKQCSIVKSGQHHLYPTTAAQEREARADPLYDEILQGLKAATEEAERPLRRTAGAMAWCGLHSGCPPEHPLRVLIETCKPLGIGLF